AISEALGRIGYLLGALPGLLGCDGSEGTQQMCGCLRLVLERLPERAVDVELRVTQQQDFKRVASFDGIRDCMRIGDHRSKLLAVGVLGRLVDRFAMRELR